MKTLLLSRAQRLRAAIAQPLVTSSWRWLRAFGYLIDVKSHEVFYGYTHPHIHCI